MAKLAQKVDHRHINSPIDSAVGIDKILIQIAYQLASAFTAMHAQDIYHRDKKSAGGYSLAT